MAIGDRGGTSQRGSEAMGKAFASACQTEVQLATESANINVGDFVSELQAAIKFRMKAGLSQGDWIEEPERAFTDGRCFAEEEAVASQSKLQVTVSLDASTSMWLNNIMHYAGPTFAALDSILRAAQKDLPEGTLMYAPFIFHGKSFRIPAAWINRYCGRLEMRDQDGKLLTRSEILKKQGGMGIAEQLDRGLLSHPPTAEEFSAAQASGEIPADAKRLWWDAKKMKWRPAYTFHDKDTRIAPLFEAIKQWEEVEGDTAATRLDIVITDGVLVNADDVRRASAIQDERNGKLRTIFLNFLPPESWDNVQLPDRCGQFAVTAKSLDNDIRTCLDETIADMFA